MPRKYISFSQINTYHFCPFKYKLEYIDNINEDQREKSPYLDFGTAIHTSIEKYLNARNKNLNIKINESIKIFEEDFTSMYKENSEKYSKKISEKEFGKWLINGSDILTELETFLKDTFGENFKSKGSEINLNESIGENTLQFKGFVDSILEDEKGKTWIVDWKTTTWGWNQEKRADKVLKYQLILYKYFLNQKLKGLDSAKTSFVLLKRTAKQGEKCEKIGILSSEKKMKEALDYLLNTIKLIERRIFIKNYMNCRKCPYKQSEHCSGLGI